MKRFDTVLLKIFLFGIPLIAGLGILAYLYSNGMLKQAGGFIEYMNGFAGLLIAAWMALSLYLSIRLVVSGPFRDKVMSRITFIRERDERESMLTGKAAKTAFLTTLSLLVLLFFLSCFQVSVYRVPPEQAVEGKTGFITLGIGFDILEHSNQDRPENVVQRMDIFSYTGLPVSSTVIILVLIIWQLVSYNYSMRRLMR